MSIEKFAIASTGGSLESLVDEQAARCPYYLLFNSSGALLEVTENPYHRVAGGAAPMAAEFLADKGAEILIAGDFGRRMVSELHEMGIGHLLLTGPIEQAVTDVLSKTR